jgi:hypothetical protein
MLYTIWYTKIGENRGRRIGWFGDTAENIPYSVDAINDTHVAVMSNAWAGDAENESANFETLFADYQADMMHERRRGDWCQWCQRRGASHSSMSIGDIIQNTRTNEYWVVASMGVLPVPATQKEVA